MATMMDVAKYAKVSKMTVSRVLNGNGYVKEETRQAVMEAVRKLDYRPNLLAKSLVTGRSRIIAYVVPDICDPFFGKICKSVADISEQRGYICLVSNTPSAQSVDRLINMMIDRKVDGVIFHHLCIRQEQADLLRRNDVQVVLVDNEYPVERVGLVENDNYSGAYKATEHLIACGYRSIACVRGDGEKGPDGKISYAESFQRRIWDSRTAGFLDALRDYGLKPWGLLDGRGSAYMREAFQCGQQTVRRLLEEPELPDAIYCQSDLIALGILGELLERGIRVPDTVALCGHDGLDTCCHLYPRITTMIQPQEQIGQKAAELLIAQICGSDRPATVTIQPELFLGDTTRL